jgi:dolichyl-phosphate beta-glucosyltransferase
MTLELSVIIPAYNEELRLPKTLAAVLDFLGKQNFTSEILVVDDGSTDGTIRIVNEFAAKALQSKIIIRVANGPHQGKGGAIRHGIQNANGAFLLFADADNSIPIEQLAQFWQMREQYDLIIGSRFLLSSRFKTQKGIRLLTSKLGNVLFRFLFRLKIADTQCGFKFVRAAVAKQIIKDMQMTGFVYDMEFLVLAHQLGYTIIELPVKWQDAPASTVRAVQASVTAFGDVMRFWWRQRIK